MNELRKKRMESQIRRELAELIHKRRTKDDALGFVSVSEVQLASDLSACRAYVSLFGSVEENRETWKALKRNAYFFQSTMARSLRLRQTPRLEFEEDDRIKEGDRILDLIEDSSRESKSKDEDNIL